MTELSEPDLTGGERVVRVFLRLLPREYGNPEGIDDEDVRTARSILAKEYVEHTNISVAWKSGLSPLPDELLSQNSLQGDIPTWLGFVATVTVCGVVLNTLLPKLRARFF